MKASSARIFSKPNANKQIEFWMEKKTVQISNTSAACFRFVIRVETESFGCFDHVTAAMSIFFHILCVGHVVTVVEFT